MNMPEVKIQMIDISTYHSIKRNATAFVVNPIVFKFCFIYRANDMTDVTVIKV